MTDAAKHPLENKWTIWYDSKKTIVDETNWEKNLQKVSDFDTVEDFWGTYNHIKRPNALEFGANYHVFKSGIKPMWEDKANKAGGRFLIVVAANTDMERLNDIWERLLLAMIGESLEENVPTLEGDLSHVTGAVLGRRRAQTKIAIWTRDCKTQEALDRLKESLVSTLQLRSDTNMTYEAHQK